MYAGGVEGPHTPRGPTVHPVNHPPSLPIDPVPCAHFQRLLKLNSSVMLSWSWSWLNYVVFPFDQVPLQRLGSMVTQFGTQYMQYIPMPYVLFSAHKEMRVPLTIGAVAIAGFGTYHTQLHSWVHAALAPMNASVGAGPELTEPAQSAHNKFGQTQLSCSLGLTSPSKVKHAVEVSVIISHPHHQHTHRHRYTQQPDTAARRF